MGHGRRIVLVILCAAWVRAETPLFTFDSNFWLNLYFLRYEKAPTPQILTPALTMKTAYLSSLAMDSPVVSKEADLAALNGASADYVEHGWLQQDAANVRWARFAEFELAQHGTKIKAELERIYQTKWPDQPISVQLTPYAGFGGAYTTLDPTRIIISSIDPGNQGRVELEVVFHEASHALIQKVSDELSNQARARGKLWPRRDFWHALLFYTVGEVVKRELKDYTPYAVANKLYVNGWQDAPAALEKDWMPYIDGKIDLQTAIQRLVNDYAR
jgi:hypothetical protein